VDPRDRQVDGRIVEVDLRDTPTQQNSNNTVLKMVALRQAGCVAARTCTATFFSCSQSILPPCCGAVLAAASASSPPTFEMAVAAST
jgi:hypothetical protein